MENYDPSSAASAGVFFAIFMACLIPALIIGVISIIGMWKVFEKAGKPGWAAIIPIYNHIVLLEIVGKPIWWIFLFLVPCVNIIYAVWTTNLLSKSFGQSEGFTIGLLLLPFIFFPVLGFVITSISAHQPRKREVSNHLIHQAIIKTLSTIHRRLNAAKLYHLTNILQPAGLFPLAAKSFTSLSV